MENAGADSPRAMQDSDAAIAISTHLPEGGKGREIGFREVDPSLKSECADPILHQCPGCKRNFKDVFRHLNQHSLCMKAYAEGQRSEPAKSMGSLAARNKIFQADIKEKVTEEFGRLRYEALTSGSAVNSFKSSVQDWLGSATHRILKELEPCISTDSGVDVAQLIKSSLGWFDGIETEWTEAAAHRNLLGRALVAPIRRKLGSHRSVIKDAEGHEYSVRERADYCYDIPLIEQMQALIEYDRAAWHQIVSSSDAWDASSVSDPWEIDDVTKGKLFREHPKLGDSAGHIVCPELGGRRIKLAYMMYYDEVETCNPLGFSRGVHKIGCTYVKILNLPHEMRDRLEYIFPINLVLNDDMKRFGAECVLAGAKIQPGTNTLISNEPSSPGGQMRQLDAGVKLSVPSGDDFGGYVAQYFHGWMVLVSADFPAAGLLLPTSQSVAATKPCRGCDWDRTSRFAEKPASLLKKKGCWRERTLLQACWLRRSLCASHCKPRAARARTHATFGHLIRR